MEKLSNQQRAIYEYIKSHQEEKGYPPSVREICQAVGLKSTSTVHGHLERLERKGLIRRDPTKPRAIELVEVQRNRSKLHQTPIVGRVTAGMPILAQEEIQGYVSLPLNFVRGEEAFILNVRGESMINAGILDGDQIVVLPNVHIYNGDIVVAMVAEAKSNESGATVKRFFRESGRIRLQPENNFMEPIFADARDVTIVGKVVGLLRSM